MSTYEVDPSVVQALRQDLTDADARFMAAILTELGRLKARIKELETEAVNLGQAIGSLGYGDRIEKWKTSPPTWNPGPALPSENDPR